MSEIPQAIVVEHAGKSYVRPLGREGFGWHGFSPEYTAINGQRNLAFAPGDDQFVVYDGAPVTNIQKIQPSQRITTKYELREDLQCAAKERVISVERYRALTGDDRALYRAVVEDTPEQFTDIPFVIQREKGPPTKLPKGVVCTDRNYFARYPSFWHLGPVRATRRYVLAKLAEHIQKIIDRNPYVTWRWTARSPENILNDTVCDSLCISAKRMIIDGIEVSPVGLKTVFTINSEDRLQSYDVFVRDIDAENLEALHAAVENYLDRLIEHLTKWSPPGRCPLCQRRYTKKPRVHPKTKR